MFFQFPPVTNLRRSVERETNQYSTTKSRVILALRRIQPPIMMIRRRGSGDNVTFDRKTRIAQMARNCDSSPTATNGAGRTQTNGHPHVTVSYYSTRIRLAPANGDSAYCYVCEREGDRNDVIGCEYGHLRLIDLYIAIG
jgi:hypothetical protein